MGFGRSLRGRIALILSAVALPAVALGLGFVVSHDREVRQLVAQDAISATMMAASGVGDLLSEVQAAAAAAIAQLPPTACGRAVSLPLLPGVDLLGVVAAPEDGSPLACASTEDPLPRPDFGAAWRVVRSGGPGVPAVALNPALRPDGSVLLAAGSGAGLAAGPVALIAVAPAVLARTLRIRVSPEPAGTAVLDRDGGLLLASGLGPWLPRDDASLVHAQAGSVIAEGQDGQMYRYDRDIVPGTRAVLMAAFPATHSLTAERQRVIATAVMFLAITALVLLGATWAVDRSVIGWLGYLRRNAFPAGPGRPGMGPPARGPLRGEAPPEVAELGAMFNRLADSAAGYASSISQALSARDASLRELHHRVKNNFQVIASLLSLHKRALPPERRDDIRFLEEHVQSMAVAYRVVYAAGDMARVRINELLLEIVNGLRQTAAAPSTAVDLELDPHDEEIGLDQAIAVGLYLAVVLPPYLDIALARSGVVRVRTRLQGGNLHLTIDGGWGRPAALDSLRVRLKSAYIGQLHATETLAEDAAGEAIVFALVQPVV